MRLKLWEPFRSFRPVNSDFESWIDRADVSEGERRWRPNVDVYENEGGYVLKADLPGMNKEDIKIDVNDGTLTIKGEKKLEEKTESENYVRVERSYGNFMRSFTLTDDVDTENIEAAYKDGVLEITLTKKEEAKPKEIQVQVN